jgi:hypothetical protein
MFVLFLPQIPLRALRSGESLSVFFLAEAQGAQRASMFILFLPHTSLRALRPGESLFVFFVAKTPGAPKNS